ncbi:MAG: hypothetical protein B1H11_11055 [Desulfobacteraceae bacterium 4484_190.1]|nr:MAG: hypothetical protein B1H11_11055 [Desulfobacteraceae bacterium 4484_190.1]
MATRKSVSFRSRLAHADLVEVDGVSFWDLPDISWVYDLDGYVEIRGDEDRLDLAAYDRLGSAELWWVVAGANQIGLAPVEYKPTKGVKVPNGPSVFSRIRG